jgi:hypothetical protein
MPSDININKFVKQGEQSVTSKLSSIGEGKLLGLESKSGIVGILSRISGEVGLTDEVFSQITSLTSKTDSFAANAFDKLFGKKDSPAQPSVPTENDKRNANTTILTYPNDLGAYATGLQFITYQRPAPLTSPTLKFTQAIFLPLPQGLTDAYGVTYTSEGLGLVGSVADSLAAGDAQSATGTAAAAGKGLARGALGKIGPGLGKLTTYAAGAALSSEVASATSQVVGAALNPNLSVTFNGPQMRQFSLSWEFVPHNAKESATIKEIIRQIKMRMLPTMTFAESTAILDYPEMVQVSMNPITTSYKRAMIEGVNVNYAQNGIPAFFANGEPMFIGLSINFIEIEYFLSGDFETDSEFIRREAQGIGRDIETTVTDLYKQGVSALPDAIKSFLPGNPQGG